MASLLSFLSTRLLRPGTAIHLRHHSLPLEQRSPWPRPLQGLRHRTYHGCVGSGGRCEHPSSRPQFLPDLQTHSTAVASQTLSLRCRRCIHAPAWWTWQFSRSDRLDRAGDKTTSLSLCCGSCSNLGQRCSYATEHGTVSRHERLQLCFFGRELWATVLGHINLRNQK